MGSDVLLRDLEKGYELQAIIVHCLRYFTAGIGNMLRDEVG